MHSSSRSRSPSPFQNHAISISSNSPLPQKILVKTHTISPVLKSNGPVYINEFIKSHDSLVSLNSLLVNELSRIQMIVEQNKTVLSSNVSFQSMFARLSQNLYLFQAEVERLDRECKLWEERYIHLETVFNIHMQDMKRLFSQNSTVSIPIQQVTFHPTPMLNDPRLEELKYKVKDLEKGLEFAIDEKKEALRTIKKEHEVKLIELSSQLEKLIQIINGKNIEIAELQRSGEKVKRAGHTDKDNLIVELKLKIEELNEELRLREEEWRRREEEERRRKEEEGRKREEEERRRREEEGRRREEEEKRKKEVEERIRREYEQLTEELRGKLNFLNNEMIIKTEKLQAFERENWDIEKIGNQIELLEAKVKEFSERLSSEKVKNKALSDEYSNISRNLASKKEENEKLKRQLEEEGRRREEEEERRRTEEEGRWKEERRRREEEERRRMEEGRRKEEDEEGRREEERRRRKEEEERRREEEERRREEEERRREEEEERMEEWRRKEEEYLQEIEEVRNNYEEENNEMEVTYKAKIQLLQNEIHQLTTRIEEIELYYSQSKNEILSLQEANKKLKTDSAAYLSQLSSIESNSRQQIEEIRAQLETKKKQVVDFEEKELKWRGERASLEGIINAGKQEIEGKIREIAEVYQLVEDRKSEIEVTTQNTRRLREENDSLRTERSRFELEMQSFIQEKENLQADLNNLTLMNENYKNKIASLNNETLLKNRELEEKIEELTLAQKNYENAMKSIGDGGMTRRQSISTTKLTRVSIIKQAIEEEEKTNNQELL